MKSKVIYLKRHSEQNIENHEGKILYIYNSRRFSTTFFGELREKTSIKTEGKITLLVDSLEEKANGYLFSEPLKSCQLLKEALQQDLDKSRQAEIETLLAKAFFLSSI